MWSTQVFNDILTQDVKQRYSLQPRHKDFWKLLVKEGLTLIANDEDNTSTVSTAQAQEFLRDEVVDMVTLHLIQYNITQPNPSQPNPTHHIPTLLISSPPNPNPNANHT